MLQVSFSMLKLFRPDFEAIFKCARTPACLGYFDEVDPLSKNTTLSARKKFPVKFQLKAENRSIFVIFLNVLPALPILDVSVNLTS